MKKRILAFVLTLSVSTFLFAGCGNSAGQETGTNTETNTESVETEQTEDTSENENSDSEIIGDEVTTGSKILIAYFSRVGITDLSGDVDAISSASINQNGDGYIGNAEILANMVAEQTGGDLFQIITEENYPTGYRDTTDQASEEKADNARPALSSHVENMEQYDFVFLIFPNWWGDLPMPLYTFLEEYDFSGKTIAPLATHEGSGLGSSVRSIENIVGNDVSIIEGLSVRGGAVSNVQSDIESWVGGMELPTAVAEQNVSTEERGENAMNILIGGNTYEVSLENNVTVQNI